MSPHWMQDILMAFIPLFVAIDPIGLIPLFLGISHGIEPNQLKVIVKQATWTAAIVAIGFVFLGHLIFTSLHITVTDFQIAGGLILFALASRDLLVMNEPTLLRADIGVVPLGVPLITGPAAITTLLILIDTVGLGLTLISLTINLILVYLAFRFGRRISEWIGITGLRAVSKIISLLLAAIAIHMIRQSLMGHTGP